MLNLFFYFISRMDCSDDENDFEALQMLTQEDDEGPEISETECDRELKLYSKTKGIKKPP